jgi:hypothetical protein
MRLFVVLLILLVSWAERSWAEEPTTTSPALWGSPTVDNAEAAYRAMVRAFIDYEQEVFAAAAARGEAPWKK